MKDNTSPTPLDHVKSSVAASIRAKENFWKKNGEQVVAASRLLADTFKNGGKVLLCGNGGSAADAQHMAAEMTGRMLVERKIPLAAIALTTDTSALTAIGNDYKFDDIFKFQTQALGRDGDLLIAISTSGNSKNVIAAVEVARLRGMKVVSFTGGTGGKLKAMSDINLNVEDGKHSSMIQETHISIIHLLVDLMDRYFLGPEYVNHG